MAILITPPTTDPVTLEQAKSHLRVTHYQEDELITAYIQAARDICENYLNRPITDGVYQTSSDSYACITIPHDATITAIEARQEDGSYSVITPDYTVSSIGLITFLDASQLPDKYTPEAVRITWTAAPAVVPPAIIAGMLLVIGHLYENREDSVIGASAVSLPRGAESLWFPHRIRLGV